MKTPSPRGPWSDAVNAALTSGDALTLPADPPAVDDASLALWTLYELSYRGFDDAPGADEWSPSLLRARQYLERDLEQRLRAMTDELVEDALGSDGGVVERLERVVSHDGPSLSTYLHREADAEQYREFLALRSIYHLKESDPQAFALPRLTGPAKVALAELLYDEFGGGAPDRLHQQLFAAALTDAGLDPTYGAYLDQAPAHVLDVSNAMSFFGLHRRWRAASSGHLAAFEMTSSLPCRRYVQGAERLGLGAGVVRYFDEHVEADAVHEQLAARSICGSLVSEDPGLERDVLFGAATCILLEEASAAATLSSWSEGGSALVTADRPVAA
ncbi:iron-containing redox enzyme family protein [Marmoricola sp. OAE513]|uniref:iron-containing redox enzyme family protein n=1 Tax=Marmoricola sp. OAE513 TaxID=2817894 RepID=UPI001AE8F2F8